MMKLLLIKFSPASCYFLLGAKYSLQHPVRKYFQLFSSLNVRDEVLYPYEITEKIIVLCILKSTFSHSRFGTKW
jgi:hypothetical protein